MKFRNGFVTNSSSTSFIISTKSQLNLKCFMGAIGANGSSPMNKIFEDLFTAIDKNKQNVFEAASTKEISGIAEFLNKKGFDKECIDKVKELISNNQVVYHGYLSSEEAPNPSELFFCSEIFVICNDDIYFNGSIGGW